MPHCHPERTREGSRPAKPFRISRSFASTLRMTTLSGARFELLFGFRFSDIDGSEDERVGELAAPGHRISDVRDGGRAGTPCFNLADDHLRVVSGDELLMVGQPFAKQVHRPRAACEHRWKIVEMRGLALDPVSR